MSRPHRMRTTEWRVRAPLAWALVLASSLSAGALWSSSGAAPLSVADGSSAMRSVQTASTVPAADRPGSVAPPAMVDRSGPSLPERLEPTRFEAAQSDPFAEPATAPPAVAAPVAKAAPPPPVRAAPAVARPAQPLRYFGRLVSPAGDVLTFIAQAERVIEARPSQPLDDGYVVESVEQGAVQLWHAASASRLTLPIASPQVEPPLAGIGGR